MNPVNQTDVVVVGGGPAGATAAYLLARLGYRVRLFDKASFPRPKVCAGLLTWKTIDLIKRVFGTRLDEMIHDGIVKHACRDYRIYFEQTEIARGCLDFPFHFVDRQIYDHYWLKRAQAAGARIETGTGIIRAVPATGEVVLTDGRSLRASIIIGADGVWSKVRKSMHGKGAAEKNWRRYLAATIETHRPISASPSPSPFASLHFGHVPWGYAWSFPGAARQTVGLACLPRKNERRLHRSFQAWMETLGIDSKELPDCKGHPLPYGNYLRKPASRRALLIGDACGLADPMLGEGIYYAHRSAQIAVHAIVAANRNWERAAAIYGSALRRELISELRFIKLLRDIIFVGGQRRRYRGLKFFFRLFPKRLEAAVQGQRSFSRLLLPDHRRTG